MSDVEDRPVTRRGRKPKKAPSSSHYVGYVEDEESILSIMKKFEELENFKQQIASVESSNKENEPENAAGEKGENGDNDEKSNSNSCEQSENPEDLTTTQLEEIFKRTSMFSAKSFNKQSNMMYNSFVGDGEDEEWREALYYRDRGDDSNDEDCKSWSDDDELWDDEYLEIFGKKTKRNKNKRSHGERSSRSEQKKTLHRKMLMERSSAQAGGQRAAIKRKEKFVDPRKPTYVRIPFIPISMSWCRVVKPLVVQPKEIPECTAYHEIDLHCNLGKFIDVTSKEKYVCIYMDPPLAQETDKEKGTISFDQFRRMKLNKLVDTGFIFIWLEKEFVPDIFALMRVWNFRYVENLCWFKKTVDNRIAKEESGHLMRSKLTCYIFRKMDKDVEIRHQRNCDVVVDFIQPKEEYQNKGYCKQYRPDDYLYQTMETLLPDARCPCNPHTNTPRIHVGQCLELWAKKGVYRQGWTSIAHVPK